MPMKKSKLAIILSNLEGFREPKAELEQYPFDGQSASEFLWRAYELGDIEGKTIGDFGCGTGILGIGALLLGARFVYFIDKSEAAVHTAKRNAKMVEEEVGESFKDRVVFLVGDVGKFNHEVNTVLQNPPFGTIKEHADRAFLEKAMEKGRIIYSVHKTSTLKFLENFAEKHGRKITHVFKMEMQLKQTMKWHKADIRRIEVSGIRMV